MSDYKPPYQITDNMLSIVASISEKLGQIAGYREFEAKPQLRRNNKIKSIHSSLRIEANSLTLGQVQDVIGGRIVMGPAKEIQEVKNAYSAYEAISNINPYSIEDLKATHEIMTKYVVEEAGKFRSGEEGVFNGNQCIFMAPPARLVPDLMESLFSWMRISQAQVHPLILSAIFHYEFVFIHPFSDGNGRMARLWHTVLLSKWKPVFEYIPLESQIEKFQDGYYEAIANCHVAGNSNEFIEFMLQQIDMVLDDIKNQIRLPEIGISGYVQRLLDRMEYDVSYSATELLKILSLKSKETLRKNYLNPAIKLSLMEMTLPDKPKSKNQRYIRK